MIALFLGKAMAFLHNPGLECSRTLQRAVGILQRAQDFKMITIPSTPCLFPALIPQIVMVFVALLVFFVARSAFQVKRAYVTMPHWSLKLLWIYCMQTCCFLVEHHLHM